MTKKKGGNIADLRNRGIVKLKDKDMFAIWVGKRLSTLNKTSK